MLNFFRRKSSAPAAEDMTANNPEEHSYERFATSTQLQDLEPLVQAPTSSVTEFQPSSSTSSEISDEDTSSDPFLPPFPGLGDRAVHTMSSLATTEHQDAMPPHFKEHANDANNSNHKVGSSSPQDVHRILPSIESDTAPRVGLRKYLPSGEVPTYYRIKRNDRSSAPPVGLGDLRNEEQFRRLNYLDRFTFDVLPPPNAPLYLQILTYVQRFASWCAEVKDEDRYERLTRYFGEKMERVWLESIRQGLIPENWDEHPAIMRKIGDDVAMSDSQKLKRKRDVDPRRKVVVNTVRSRFCREHVITLGELEEAGVDIEKVERRVASGDLGDADVLMRNTLDIVDRDKIRREDWQNLVTQTNYNPSGRELQNYCLWEVQNSQSEIQKLENLKQGFGTAQQVRNTQDRINAEQLRLDYCMAIALESYHREMRDNRSEAADSATSSNSQEKATKPGDDEVDQALNRTVGNDRTLDSFSSEEAARQNAFDQWTAQGNNSLDYSTTQNQPFSNGLATPPETPVKIGGKRPAAAMESRDSAAKRLKDLNGNSLEQQLDPVSQKDTGMLTEVMNGVPGYPTKAEILRALPRTGWRPDEVFQFHEHDPIFVKLMQSVAHFDKNQMLWFPNNPQASAMNLDGAVPVPNGHHAMMVRLPYTAEVNPEDYSIREVHNAQGFRWRYYPGTTAGERCAMLPHIDSYVNQIIERDKLSARSTSFKTIRRQGNYELLANPLDPSRKTIVHGIWDRMKDTPVHNSDWFYAGEDGEWMPRNFHVVNGVRFEGDETAAIEPSTLELDPNNQQSSFGQASDKAVRPRSKDGKSQKQQHAHPPTSSLNKPKKKGKPIQKRHGRRRTDRPKTMLEERRGRAPRAAALNQPRYDFAEEDGNEGYLPYTNTKDDSYESEG